MSMNDDIDPSIAALLEETEDSLPETPDVRRESEAALERKSQEIRVQIAKQHDAVLAPKLEQSEKKGKSQSIPALDLSVQEFKKLEKSFEDKPNPVYDDPSYYKTALGGEGQSAQRLHQILVKYLNCTDKKDRTVYRQQIVTAYWEFLRSLATKMSSPQLPLCKRMAMRYGIVLPSLFTPEQKDFFSRAFMGNQTGEPILYMDEWIRAIALGHLSLSATDEVSSNRAKGPGADQTRIQQLKSKNSGKLQNADNLLSLKENERRNAETEINELIKNLFTHTPVYGLEPHTMPYSESQRKLFSEIANRFRSLQKIDRELSNYLNDLQEAKQIEQSLASKESMLPEEEINVDTEEILTEMNSLRQMAKMTCGRQGNQFPIFTREFFHCFDKTTGFRENVLRELAWIESIDPEAFCRVHKSVLNRIVPYVLLVPTYGDTGFCWEPFDRFNRVTSRGRIIIPMYPRDLKIACLTAVADLRWQVAKEKASFDWMTDGLTGHYYQYIDSKKMKGDVKAFFIEDYILWMTKESNGNQKLEKEVRGIFWRYIPFRQSIKDDLRNRSLIYQELYQRDINRSMSDGY